jgi:hypothetical protein
MSPPVVWTSDEFLDRFLRGHWPFSAGGDGCAHQQLVREWRHRSASSAAAEQQRSTNRKVYTAIVDDCNAETVSTTRSRGLVTDRGGARGHAPLILYSPLSWLLELRMLRADEALEPTVSTRSKVGGLLCAGWRFSSLAASGRRAKGFRIGMTGRLVHKSLKVESRGCEMHRTIGGRGDSEALGLQRRDAIAR